MTKKTKKTWTMIAILANLVLLPLALATPDRTAASSSGVFFPCCQGTATGIEYCCSRCCIFTWDCMAHDHCGEMRLGTESVRP